MKYKKCERYIKYERYGNYMKGKKYMRSIQIATKLVVDLEFI